MNTLGRRNGLRLVMIGLLVGGLLAACQRDKGDPLKISRNFIISLWSGDVEQVQMLACQSLRTAAVDWARGGDSTVTVDDTHLVFEIIGETDHQVAVQLSGVVTFQSTQGQVEVRNLDESGPVVLVLVDESGWKVCDLQTGE